jgi:hypothetical protein
MPRLSQPRLRSDQLAGHDLILFRTSAAARGDVRLWRMGDSEPVVYASIQDAWRAVDEFDLRNDTPVATALAA